MPSDWILAQLESPRGCKGLQIEKGGLTRDTTVSCLRSDWMSAKIIQLCSGL